MCIEKNLSEIRTDTKKHQNRIKNRIMETILQDN